MDAVRAMRLPRALISLRLPARALLPTDAPEWKNSLLAAHRTADQAIGFGG